MPPAGPLRSTGITPLHRYYEPIRQALTFDALHLSTRAPTLLRGVSPRGETPFSVFTMALAYVPPLFTPPDALAADRVPQALLSSPAHRRLDLPGFVPHEVLTERSLIVAARMLAHPAKRGFVGGLRMQDLPCIRHPSYAASIFYRFVCLRQACVTACAALA